MESRNELGQRIRPLTTGTGSFDLPVFGQLGQLTGQPLPIRVRVPGQVTSRNTFPLGNLRQGVHDVPPELGQGSIPALPGGARLGRGGQDGLDRGGGQDFTPAFHFRLGHDVPEGGA